MAHSNVKTAIENFDDMKKVQDYFINREEWNLYLLYTLNINTGRRISDLLGIRWADIFNSDGSMKEYWIVMHEKDGEIAYGEKKTKKRKEVYLNSAVQEAFNTYLQKQKGINFERDYNDYVFRQVYGSHKGKVLTKEGYRQALIRAEKCIGYEIRSHSMRRGMGNAMIELHPNDPKAKSILMEIYNHSSEKMTNKYIGETSKLEKQYFEDLGDSYQKYVMHGEEIPFATRNPVSVYNNAELRDYMLSAFSRILSCKDDDSVQLMKLYNELLDGLEQIAK